MFRLTTLTRVAAIGAVLATAACESKRDLLAPTFAPGAEIFTSYVALGNSITAGYQSGGINDSTQRQSFARLLAAQMGTQYHYASLAGRGCPVPIQNGVTGELYLKAPAGTCDLRAASSVTDVLNNVAVPGARVLDPSSASTAATNALTSFILAGKTQVQKALEARPTFATIWIGNNDVLQAGVTGMLAPTAGVSPGIVSTQAQFETSYDLMIKQLLDSAPGLKGVLIGVVQVAGVPVLSRGGIIYNSPATFKAGLTTLAGKSVAIDTNCNGGGAASLVNIPLLIQQIRAGAHPGVISCLPSTAYPAPIGSIFVLDPTEQATLGAAITGYNNYIKAKAAAIGFAYYDPNPLLAAQQATGAIPPLPDFSKPTATFGTLISLDGIHPAAAAHRLIANDLIATINTTYHTSLQPLP
jgi:lysophospholipase L1-like esterase